MLRSKRRSWLISSKENQFTKVYTKKRSLNCNLPTRLVTSSKSGKIASWLSSSKGRVSKDSKKLLSENLNTKTTGSLSKLSSLLGLLSLVSRFTTKVTWGLFSKCCAKMKIITAKKTSTNFLRRASTPSESQSVKLMLKRQLNFTESSKTIAQKKVKMTKVKKFWYTSLETLSCLVSSAWRALPTSETHFWCKSSGRMV